MNQVITLYSVSNFRFSKYWQLVLTLQVDRGQWNTPLVTALFQAQLGFGSSEGLGFVSWVLQRIPELGHSKARQPRALQRLCPQLNPITYSDESQWKCPYEKHKPQPITLKLIPRCWTISTRKHLQSTEKVISYFICGCLKWFSNVEGHCVKAFQDVYKVLDYACNSCLFKHF